MNILTSTELLRKIAHVIRNNMVFLGGTYYLRALFKSIFFYFVVFLLESAHEAAQRLIQIRTIYDDESLWFFVHSLTGI